MMLNYSTYPRGGGVIEQLEKSDICYVAGGNTFFLLEHMKKTNFKDALEKRMDDNLLYIGSSAGSIVMSPDIDFISPMDEKEKANLDDTTGLNYIPFSFLPHVGHETMGNAAEIIKQQYKQGTPLYCFDDSQAIYIDGNRVEIL